MNLKEPFIVEFQGQDLRRFEVRYPPAAFWKDRTKAQKIQRKSEGGKMRSKVGETRALDMKQVQSGLIAGPDDFDEYDAEYIIDLLARCTAQDVTMIEPNIYRVQALAFGGEEVSVDLRTPSRRQAVRHRDDSADMYSTSGGSATIVTIQPTIDLFEALLVASNGYVDGAIPVPHMDVYLQQVLETCYPNL
jgi:hypothetical protein